MTLLAGCAIAWADVHYVSPSGSSDPPYTKWTTAARGIQDAVDASVNGDHVEVAEGQYDLAASIVVSKAIALRSAGDRTPIIIK